MSGPLVTVRELAGWDLDAYPYRPCCIPQTSLAEARRQIAQRNDHQNRPALVDLHPDAISTRIGLAASRADLHAEMAGLDWSLSVVDLRHLLAFQRRLSFDPAFEAPSMPRSEDWDALMNVCFGAEKQLAYRRVDDLVAPGSRQQQMVFASSDPNLQIRASDDRAAPFLVHAGSPFFEVAEYRGRWFLRDGYHRAYWLLRAAIYQVPAVVVRARTLEELGATRPWFFSEEILLSCKPPRVFDFLDDALVFHYHRPPLIKTFRVTIEESLEPALSSGDPS